MFFVIYGHRGLGLHQIATLLCFALL